MQQLFFAQKAFIVKDGMVLLVRKSADDPDQAGKWEVPGGRMEFGEDVDEHIKREVREEVGLELMPGRPFYIWQWRLRRPGSGGEPIEIQIVAVARLCNTESTVTSETQRKADDFLGETRWVPFKDVESFEVIANMRPVVAAFLLEMRR
jgi:8-oxo-dGTP pyrophosphatase MutT (NUDIX family)